MQTLPEEFFTCANLQPDRKHSIQQGQWQLDRSEHGRCAQCSRRAHPFPQSHLPTNQLQPNEREYKSVRG